MTNSYCEPLILAKNVMKKVLENNRADIKRPESFRPTDDNGRFLTDAYSAGFDKTEIINKCIERSRHEVLREMMKERNERTSALLESATEYRPAKPTKRPPSPPDKSSPKGG